MSYFVYILQSLKDNKLYIGQTNDVNKRLERHNNGQVTATRDRKPFKIIHIESFATRAGEMQGAAGAKVWNETFRCLIYPELTQYGKEIWEYLSGAQKEASEHFDTLEEIFNQKGMVANVLKINVARKYLSLTPARYK
ncbi:MAG: hypothetical protein ACD_11C00028G0007 [uncultured bacterium]|nr:MAG: hypothetical protein ACD_11C00028G0007 [uncultured bacterium]